MRNLSAVVLLSMVSACSFSTNRQQPPPPPPGYGYGPPPPGYGYPPPGYPQGPQPGYAGGVGRGPMPPQSGPQPGFPQPGFAPGAMPGFPGAPPQAVQPIMSPEPINIQQIQSLKARDPKGCGFNEVSPGNWIRVDCHAYQPSTRAIAHLSPRKAALVSNHQAQWRPHKFFAGFVRSAMFQRGPLDQQTAGGARAVQGGLVRSDNFPATVDHRLENLEGPVKDQGPVGSCTAFSLSSTIDNQAIRAGKFTPQQGTRAASANHVWAGYGFPQMGAAADATLGRSIAPTDLWGPSHSEACKIANPIIGDCGTAVTPPVVAGTWRSDPLLVAKSDRANAGGIYKVAGFERLETPVKVDQLLTTLSSGSDLWVAFRIDGFLWSQVKIKPNAAVRDAVIPDWDGTNGGHAVTMSGFRETPQGRQYLLHNNWGASWGDGGYAWVSERMVLRHMDFAYKVKLADGVDVQPGQPTDDDCGPDELVDLLSGKCGSICPDGSRANNGCGGGGGQQPPPFQLPPGFPPIPGFTPPAPSK